jgi:hypothetical protein
MNKKTWKLLVCIFALGLVALLAGQYAEAKDAGKDEDPLKNAGVVLNEILQAPDSIPHLSRHWTKPVASSFSHRYCKLRLALAEAIAEAP